jgi:hypothetical protein
MKPLKWKSAWEREWVENYPGGETSVSSHQKGFKAGYYQGREDKRYELQSQLAETQKRLQALTIDFSILEKSNADLMKDNTEKQKRMDAQITDTLNAWKARDELADRLIESQRRLDELSGNEQGKRIVELAHDKFTLQKRLDEAEMVIAFYADGKNWFHNYGYRAYMHEAVARQIHANDIAREYQRKYQDSHETN